jgi:hypothetical protein
MGVAHGAWCVAHGAWCTARGVSATAGRKLVHQMRGLLASRIMSRTTLDLDSSVLEQLRRRAQAEHKSMGQVASERLATALRDDTPAEPTPVRWSTLHMGRPKVDLADKDALWKVLDGEPVASGSRVP